MMGLILASRNLHAADLSITSILGNGTITWSNIVGSSTATNIVFINAPEPVNYHRLGCYSVEWASVLTNGWNAGWQSLDGILPKGSNMTVGIPMFFRLKYTPADNMFWPTISGRRFRFEDVDSGVTNYSVWQYVSSFVSPSSSKTYFILERSWEKSERKAYYVGRFTANELYMVDNNSGIEGVVAKTGPPEQPWTYYSDGKVVTSVILAVTNCPSLPGMPSTNSVAICHQRRTAAGSLWYEWFVPGFGLVAMWSADGSSERLISVIDP